MYSKNTHFNSAFHVFLFLKASHSENMQLYSAQSLAKFGLSCNKSCYNICVDFAHMESTPTLKISCTICLVYKTYKN